MFCRRLKVPENVLNLACTFFTGSFWLTLLISCLDCIFNSSRPITGILVNIHTIMTFLCVWKGVCGQFLQTLCQDKNLPWKDASNLKSEPFKLRTPWSVHPRWLWGQWGKFQGGGGVEQRIIIRSIQWRQHKELHQTQVKVLVLIRVLLLVRQLSMRKHRVVSETTYVPIGLLGPI